MKTIVIFAGLICALCLFHVINAEPGEAQLHGVEAQPLTELSRQKRATCDLLSGFGINHSACAAQCLLRDYRSGYCNGRGICVCRH